MKRLRLRRGWVILAIILLMIPFLGRGAEDASAETEVGQQYTIGFSATNGDMDNSLDVARWDIALGTATGFVPYNPGSMSARITFTDGTEVDPEIFSSIVWDYTTKQASSAIGVTKLQDAGDPLKCNFTTSVNNAGLILVEVKATFILEGDVSGTEFTIRRELIIAAPLQVKSETSLGEDYKLIRSPEDIYHSNAAHKELKEFDYIYANHTSDANIYWYYKDALTNATCALANPSGTEASSSRTLEYMGDTQVELQSDTKDGFYQYKVSAKYGGMTTLVARIYLNNSLTQAYIEREFEIITVAGVTHQKNHDSDNDGVKDIYQVELKFGQAATFASLSNDRGNTLGWNAEDSDVVTLNQTAGIIGNFYGTSVINLTPIAKGYKSYATMTFAAEIYDKLLVSTKAALLKGSTDAARVAAEEVEVLNIGSEIIISTNVRAKDSGYEYKWFYIDATGAAHNILTNGADTNAENCVKAVGGATIQNGDYTHLKLTGRKAGTLKLRCMVTADGVPLEALSLTVKVIDSLVLNESEKKIPVGSSFTLRGTSNSTGNMTFTSGDSKSVSVDKVTGKNNEATVTGLKVTNGWITITVAQEVGGQTLMATCRVQVIDAVKEGTIEGNKTILVGKTTDLTLAFQGAVPNYTSDEIKWVIKNKDGTTGVIELIENTDPLQITVKGLKVGETYLAAVTNDSVQTEIAVATIRVVAAPTALILKDHDVLGYLPDKQYQLTYTIEPEGYVDGAQVVYWQSLDESIATVDSNGLVTYKGVGKVEIKAYVVGAVQELADYCTFIIENPAASLTLDPVSASMRVGESLSVKATITPENTSNRKLTWDSTNNLVATVAETGEVKAVGAGSAIITCTTSNGKNAQCVITVQVPAKSIELNYTEITVRKGTVFYMAAKVMPLDAYDREVIWSVSDEGIVSIAEDGTVTAEGVGETIITATSKDDKTIKAECKVTVEEGITGITLNVRDKTIAVAEQFRIIPSIRPSDAVNKNVTYTSSNTGVATVDEEGMVTGVHGGTTIITVKTEERGLIATCTITVQEDIKAISLNMEDIYLGKGQTKQITYTLNPVTATMKSLKWTSSDESIAIVDNEGNIRGINLGTVTITAQAKDASGIKATCKVTVINSVNEIKLSDQMIKLMATDTHQMQYTLTPASASVQKVTWTTSNPAIAKVDSFGVITAIGEGECDITATATDGSGTKASCRVVVLPYIPITSVSVNSTETTMVVGDSRRLTTRTYPYNTTENVNWVSGDTSIATVDGSGNVRAVGPGVTTISAMGNRSGVSSAATITVLGLNASDITLEQYDSYDLYLDGVNKGITWFSRDKRIATVTAGGKVIARRPGTTTVVARVNGKLVSCTIKVETLKKITQASAQ